MLRQKECYERSENRAAVYGTPRPGLPLCGRSPMANGRSQYHPMYTIICRRRFPMVTTTQPADGIPPVAPSSVPPSDKIEKHANFVQFSTHTTGSHPSVPCSQLFDDKTDTNLKQSPSGPLTSTATHADFVQFCSVLYQKRSVLDAFLPHETEKIRPDHQPSTWHKPNHEPIIPANSRRAPKAGAKSGQIWPTLRLLTNPNKSPIEKPDTVNSKELLGRCAPKKAIQNKMDNYGAGIVTDGEAWTRAYSQESVTSSQRSQRAQEPAQNVQVIMNSLLNTETAAVKPRVGIARWHEVFGLRGKIQACGLNGGRVRCSNHIWFVISDSNGTIFALFATKSDGIAQPPLDRWGRATARLL